MGFGWKDALKIGMGAGLGFLAGGPIGAAVGGISSARKKVLELVGPGIEDEYEDLLVYLRGLGEEDISNKVRRSMGMEMIREKFEAGGKPFEERHVRATLENALLDITGDLAGGFDPE